MEVQCLAALGMLFFTILYLFFHLFLLYQYLLLVLTRCLVSGSHANIVGYYTSWFENEKLYIQMELCDHSLCVNNISRPFTEGEVLVALYQVCVILLTSFSAETS